MRIRDILTRFRPAGAPGAAATGVPADRAAELAAELEPPLALLTQAQAEAAAIREAANREAEAIRKEAARQAAITTAEAHDRAGRLRAETADRARRAGAEQAAEVQAVAEHDVALLRSRVAQRMPAVVERAVTGLLRGLEADAAGQPEGRARWAPGGSPG